MIPVNPDQLGLSPEATGHLASATTQAAAAQKRRRAFTVLAVLLIIAFSGPLWSLIRLALKTDIQSHILLIPFIFLYLWKTSRSADSNPQSAIRNPKFTPAFRAPYSAGSLLPASLAAVAGLAGLVAYWVWGKTGPIAHDNALSLATASFLSLLLAAALATLGWQALRPRLFSISFLVFMIPLPLPFIEFMSIGLQRASAEAADWMLALTGMPFFRTGLVFQFPGLAVRVAEECSGVRSTFVLLITSVLAGHLFLRTGWKRILLALAIFPLGILRNGFRITVISWLTVNFDPGIIDSALHRRGGPIFFVLSLVPLFGLLWMLRRSERPQKNPKSPRSGVEE